MRDWWFLAACALVLRLGNSQDVSTVYTTGGNAGGKPCAFPFIYGGVSYTGCTNVNNNNVAWCYTATGSWGNCVARTDITAVDVNGLATQSGRTCSFPYSYRPYGSSAVNYYYACPSVDNIAGKSWCSTKPEYALQDWTDHGAYCLQATTTTTTASSGCTSNDYTQYANTLSYGGTEQTGANTLDKCKEACTALSLTDCSFFDFDADNKCWIHPSRNTPRQVTNKPNVSQYVRTPCTTTAATTTAAPATTTASGTGCTDTFNKLTNTLSYQGSLDASITTLDGCKAKCLATSTCLAFDYTKANKCYYHLTSAYLGLVNANVKDVDQYRRQSCTTVAPSTLATGSVTVPTTTSSGCTDSFDKVPNTLAYGGERYDAATTLVKCKERCLSLGTCVALDYNRVRNVCWIHNDINNLNNLNANSKELDLFKRLPCGVTVLPTGQPTSDSTCKTTYKKHDNVLYFGGDDVGVKNTPVDCESTCTASATCLGFDYNRVTKKCFTHSNPASLEDGNKGTGAANIDHYRKGTSCDTVSTTTASACTATYQEYLNQLSFGGTASYDEKTKEACMNKCTLDPSCLAFDFDMKASAIKCFIHTSQTTLANTKTVENVNQYRITSRTGCGTAPTTTAAPGGCRGDIVFLVDSSGSIEDSGVNNYVRIKNFIKAIVNTRDVGPDATRVALIIFSNYAELQFDFNDHATKAALEEAIDKIAYIGGDTFTSMALNEYRTKLYGNSDRGNRPDVKDVIVFITDGNTSLSDRDDLDREINALPSADNLKRIGVGIGNIDMAEMRKIVSTPFDDLYHPVENFDALKDTVNNILGSGQCSGVTPPNPGPTVNGRMAVFAFRVDSTQSAMYPVFYPYEHVDINGNFDIASSIVTVTGSIIWVSLSVGVKPYTTVDYSVSTSNGPYDVAVRRDTPRHDGYDTLSKDAIYSMTPGTTFKVNSQSPLYSDTFRQTSLTAFSVSNIVGSDVVNFMAGLPAGSVSGPGTLVFTNEVLDSHNAYNPTTGIFTCPTTGIYIFSFGIYVRTGSALRAELRVGSQVYELRRTHTYHLDGGDSLSRPVLTRCAAGEQAQVYVLEGSYEGKSDYATSFMGFMYKPKDISANAYFDYSRYEFQENPVGSTGTMPLVFTSRNYAEGVNSATTNVQDISCQIGGYYYVSLTVEAAPNKKVNVYVAVDGEERGGIYRSTINFHGGFYDTLSRSAIVLCNQGQRISVRLGVDSAIGQASSVNIKGNSLFGILLYKT